MDAPAVQPFLPPAQPLPIPVPPPPLLPPTYYSMIFRVLIVSAIPVIIMLVMRFFLPRISGRYNDRHHHRRRRFELRSHDTERVGELMEGLKRAMMEASDGFVHDKLKGINGGGDKSSTGTTIESCAICLDDFKDGDLCRALRECDHVFHKECVVSWLMNSNSCPICRAFVPSVSQTRLFD